LGVHWRQRRVVFVHCRLGCIWVDHLHQQVSTTPVCVSQTVYNRDGGSAGKLGVHWRQRRVVSVHCRIGCIWVDNLHQQVSTTPVGLCVKGGGARGENKAGAG
jgi:hypothetical protein